MSGARAAGPVRTGPGGAAGRGQRARAAARGVGGRAGRIVPGREARGGQQWSPGDVCTLLQRTLAARSLQRPPACPLPQFLPSASEGLSDINTHSFARFFTPNSPKNCLFMKIKDTLTSVPLPLASLHLVPSELLTQGLFFTYLSVYMKSPPDIAQMPLGCLGTTTHTETVGVGASDVV